MNLKFDTKTIVATGLGAAVFLVLFMYVKIPSPVPETNLQIAYGVSSFFAAVFGPLWFAMVELGLRIRCFRADHRSLFRQGRSGG